MRILTVEDARAIVSSVDELKDKQIAFKEVPENQFYVLAIVVKDEQGYRPLPWQVAHGTENQMRKNADDLNIAFGVSDAAVAQIIISSMRLGHGRKNGSRSALAESL